MKILMKKLCLAILLSGIVSGTLAGCGTLVEVQEGSVEGQAESMPATENEGSKIKILLPTLPQQYFITYDLYETDGTIQTLSKAADENGNVYYELSGQEYLFLKENEKYVLYQGEADVFIEDTTQSYQKDYVEGFSEEFEQCIQKGMVQTGELETADTSSTLLGRECNNYSILVKVINFEQRYYFSIDKETNICLKWAGDKTISGFDGGEDEGFLCTRFDTEDIHLEDMLTTYSVQN